MPKRDSRKAERVTAARSGNAVYRSFVLLGMILIACATVAYSLLNSLPKAPNSASVSGLTSFSGWFTLVRTLDVKQLSSLYEAMRFYVEVRYCTILILFSLCYLGLQALAIPGPVVLSILAGPLFGNVQGFLIVTLCATTGATLCYLLFGTIGKPIVERYMSKAMLRMKGVLADNRGDLFFYFLFLRVTPILPNWLINIGSGNLRVPLKVFVPGTILGLVPNNLVMLIVGSELVKLATMAGGSEQTGDSRLKVMTPERIAALLAVGVLSVLPVVIKRFAYAKAGWSGRTRSSKRRDQ